MFAPLVHANTRMENVEHRHVGRHIGNDTANGSVFHSAMLATLRRERCLHVLLAKSGVLIPGCDQDREIGVGVFPEG